MAGQMKTVEVVAALVVDDSGRVLEFPGGKLEPGESPEQAVRREMAEELAAEVEVGELLKTVEWDYPTFHLKMHCLLCKLLSPSIQLKEHVDYRWLGADALNSVTWLPADVDVLDELRTHLS